MMALDLMSCQKEAKVSHWHGNLSSSSMVSSTFVNGCFVAESSFDGATSVANLVFDALTIVQVMRTTKNMSALDTERERRNILSMVEIDCCDEQYGGNL